MHGSTKVLVPTPGLTILPLATTILFLMIGAKGCSKVSFIRVKQARKSWSYASSKLWPNKLLTEVKCRATSVDKKSHVSSVKRTVSLDNIDLHSTRFLLHGVWHGPMALSSQRKRDQRNRHHPLGWYRRTRNVAPLEWCIFLISLNFSHPWSGRLAAHLPGSRFQRGSTYLGGKCRAEKRSERAREASQNVWELQPHF